MANEERMLPACPRCDTISRAWSEAVSQRDELESEVARLREVGDTMAATLMDAHALLKTAQAEIRRLNNARALLRELAAAVRAFFNVRKRIAAAYVPVSPQERIESERALYEVLQRVDAEEDTER